MIASLAPKTSSIRFTLTACVICLSAFLAIFARGDEKKVALRIAPHKGEEVAALAMVAPGLRFHLLSGPWPEPGAVLLCSVANERREYGDHNDGVIVFRCGDSVLELRGLDF